MRTIRKSSFLFTLFITCLNFTPTAYLNGQLKVDWYRTDTATYTGQPISVIKSSTLDGVEIQGITEAYYEDSALTTPITGLPVDAGTYYATVTFPEETLLRDLTGLEFTIERAQILVVAQSKSKEYGDSNPSFDYEIQLLSNDDPTVVITGSPVLTTTATQVSNVGSYEIDVDLTGMSADNYTFSAVKGTLSVTPAPLAINANNASRGYGQANPAFTYTATGLKNGESQAEVLEGEPTFTTTANSVSVPGSYPVSVSRGTLTANNGNYSFSSFNEGSLTIGKQSQTYTPPGDLALNLQYGDSNSDYLPSSTDQGLTVSYTSSAPSIADVSGNSITAKGVGFATITASQAGDNIYLPIASFNQITIYVSAKGVDLSDFPRFGLVEVSDSSLPVDFDIESKLLQTYIYKTQNNSPSDATGPYIQYEVLWAGDGTNTAVIQDPSSDPGTLSVNAVGPVILKVSLDDPEGNYSATSAIRVLEIIEGPGDTDNTDPTDNTPVVDYNPPATPTPSTPPSGTPDPLISGQSLDGTNWYYLDWFGFYYMDPADNGWIYHVEHGWLWASDFNNLPVWFWHPGQLDGTTVGWIYTQDNQDFTYPFFYWHDQDKRIWYQRVLGNGSTLFYDYSSFSWFEISQN